jgi:Ca-activated chloride channel family protein
VRHQRLVLPSWLASAVFHGAMLSVSLWVSQTRGCRPDYPGEGGEGFRTVGVYVTSGETEHAATDVASDESTLSARDPASAAGSMPLLEGPPIELEQPRDFAEPVLGIGGPPQVAAGSRFGPQWETTPLAGPPPSGTGVPGVLGKATSFLGVQDAGRRFVYVLDRSGSMDNGPLLSAKVELMASLENLDARQEFQVIFYNSDAISLVPRNKHFTMFRGNDTHRLEVQQQLEMIDAAGGTSHLKALEAALKYDADVIFFLTDADELDVKPDDLTDITRRNGGGARIHCIEFGDGPDLTLPKRPRNALLKLANENGGTYRYVDVSGLR